MALVEDGVTVSLAGDADTVEAVDNPYPYGHEMVGINSDRLSIQYHGIAHTHLDALAHINDGGVFNNGYTPDADEVIENGHPKNSIHNLKKGIVTRGILIDIPRLRGAVSGAGDADLRRGSGGVGRIRWGEGLVRRRALHPHGRLGAPRRGRPWLRGRRPGGRSAGLHPSVIPWLKARDVALMGSDHPTYVAPSELPGAVHDFALLYPGVHLFDNCDLEALAEAAAERSRWEFLLMAAPLPIRGGTGSPLNPIAVFGAGHAAEN